MAWQRKKGAGAKPPGNEDDSIRQVLSHTKIEAIMSPEVVSIVEDTHFSNVPQLFTNHNIRHLPVVDEDNELVGLMTQRELYKIQSPRKLEDGSWYYDESILDNIILSHVMIKDLLTLHPEDTVKEAVFLMVHHKCGCIPIVDEKNILCGIITQHDILKITLAILKG